MTFHSANGTRDIPMQGDPEEFPQEAEENKVPESDPIVSGGFTDTEKNLIDAWLVNVETLIQEDPDLVQDVIDLAGATDDVTNSPLPYVTGKFLEALDMDEQSSFSLINAAPLIQNVTKQEWFDSLNATVQAYGTMSPLRSSCDCEYFYSNMMTMPDAEFNNCMTACINYVPGQETNDNGNGGGGLNIQVPGFLEDLWDATIENAGTIIQAFLPGGGNNQGGGGTTIINQGGNGDDTEENKVDWGKIAVWGGVLIAVGLGAYFVFRKK